MLSYNDPCQKQNRLSGTKEFTPGVLPPRNCRAGQRAKVTPHAGMVAGLGDFAGNFGEAVVAALEDAAALDAHFADCIKEGCETSRYSICWWPLWQVPRSPL